jgi:hypothetical protein
MSSPCLSPFTARRRILLGSALGLLALASPIVGLMAESSAPAATGEVKFMRDVAPILVQRCFSCHDAKAEEPGGNLRLDIYESMTKGDHPAVLPGDPENSGIIQYVTEEDSSSRMPRDDDPLTAAQIELIRRWIQAGAKFDGPDPKTPYAKKPETPGKPTGAPHPVEPPVAPSEREQKDRTKAEASERKAEKS